MCIANDDIQIAVVVHVRKLPARAPQPPEPPRKILIPHELESPRVGVQRNLRIAKDQQVAIPILVRVARRRAHHPSGRKPHRLLRQRVIRPAPVVDPPHRVAVGKI